MWECDCIERERQRAALSSKYSTSHKLSDRFMGAMYNIGVTCKNSIPIVNKLGINCTCSPSKNAMKHIENVGRGLMRVDAHFLMRVLKISPIIFYH